MILTIKTVEEIDGDYGRYLKVSGVDGKGKENTKNVGEKFEDKWGLLKENATVEFKMIQKDSKWYIDDIMPIKESLEEKQETRKEPARKPQTDSRSAEIERNMFWKEMGEWLRLKEADKGADPFWMTLRTIYLAKMLDVLDIKIEKKEE